MLFHIKKYTQLLIVRKIRRHNSQKEKFISFRYSYVSIRVKKDKMIGSGALGCANRADKNSNIITLVTIITKETINVSTIAYILSFS